MIKCRNCNINKEETAFNASDIAASRFLCKICKREYRKNRYANNRTKALDLIKEKILIKCRKCELEVLSSEYAASSLQQSDQICRKCKNEQERIWWDQNRAKKNI